MQQLLNLLDDFKHDHSLLYSVTLVATVISLLIMLLMILPDSSLCRAIGVTSLQRKASSFGNAVYWTYRAKVGADHQEITSPHIVYGNLVGVDKDGKILIATVQENQFVNVAYSLADTVIIDVYGVAKTIGSLKQENVKCELYDKDVAVIWIRGAPLNIKLIEEGIAKPDPNPPTSIVDMAFAAYYWSQFKGDVDHVNNTGVGRHENEN